MKPTRKGQIKSMQSVVACFRPTSSKPIRSLPCSNSLCTCYLFYLVLSSLHFLGQVHHDNWNSQSHTSRMQISLTSSNHKPSQTHTVSHCFTLFFTQATLQPILRRAHEAPHLQRGHFRHRRAALWAHHPSRRRHRKRAVEWHAATETAEGRVVGWRLVLFSWGLSFECF